jgi:hypothetical protein
MFTFLLPALRFLTSAASFLALENQRSASFEDWSNVNRSRGGVVKPNKLSL